MQERPTGQSAETEELASVERSITENKSAKANEGDDEGLSNSNYAESVSNPEPSVLQAESIGTPQPDAAVTSSAPLPSARTTNDDYPPEIAEMIENSVPKDLQARYESDEREESWATYMEAQFAAYFAQKPALAQFNFSLIDCRTSICEIHTLAYGPDAFPIWNSATADITHQPWHDFNRMSVSNHNPQPDILGIVLILSKNGD